MASIFDKWNQSIDGEALAKDVKEAAANSGEYEEIPHGKYEVKVEKMELAECKSEKNKGMPMIKVQFRIVGDNYNNACIFMNNLLVQPFAIHMVCEFLRSLDSGVNVEFDGNYSHFNDTIMDVMEAIDGKLEYLLDYSQNKKGYNQYRVEEVFEV